MIKSTDLRKDMILSLGDDVLTVKEIKREKVKTIAVCVNQKGKRVEKTVSELYYGHAKILDPKTKKPVAEKKTEAKAKREEPAARRKTKRSTLVYIRRGEGVAITARDKDGKTIWSSWQRLNTKERRGKAA